MRSGIAHLKRVDPVLSGLIEQVGPFRMNYREPSFEAMVRSITFQQLNGKAAATIFDRFVAACGGSLSPEAVLGLSEQQMRACGLSRQKITYIRDLAAKTQSGAVDFGVLKQMAEEDVIAHLTQVKGVGVWSAQMFLMFALRHPDIMPTGDYGVRAAIKKHYRKRKLPTPSQMLKLSEPWRPYRSIACWYLWRSLSPE